MRAIYKMASLDNSSQRKCYNLRECQLVFGVLQKHFSFLLAIYTGIT